MKFNFYLSLYLILQIIIKQFNCQQSYSKDVDSEIIDVAWCYNQNSANIDLLNMDEKLISLTQQGTVYVSEDKGKTWEKQINLFSPIKQAKMKKNNDKQEQKRHKIIEIIKNPFHPNTFIFIGSNHTNFVTTDCLQTTRAMHHGRSVSEFQFHPNEPEWVLASAWTTCQDNNNKGNKPCENYKELYYTLNLGQSWKSILTYVYQFSWARTFAHSQVEKQRIIVSYEPRGYGNQTNTGWKESLRVSYSDNFFKTVQSLVLYGNRFLITKDFMFIAKAEDQTSKLMVSKDPHQLIHLQGEIHKEEYNFVPITIQGEDMSKIDSHAYTILSSTKNKVFLHINHEGPFSKYGSIYTSDQNGINYVSSLKYHVRSSDGQTDFEKLQGLQGIIIVNSFEDSNVSEFQQMAKQYNLFDLDIQNNQNLISSLKQKPQVFELDQFKKSKITYDNGAFWSIIKPPKEERDMCLVKYGCSLHLNSYSTKDIYGPIYSTRNSVGLMIGTGNTGEYLSQKPDQQNTYLSTDGGKEWKMIAKGSHIYEVGDHGGIIVMCSDQYATNKIQYSFNEGDTWQDYYFSDKPVEVTNIITEPSNVATTFLIVAQNQDKNRSYGTMITIDFQDLMQNKCQGVHQPGEEDSDYEIWGPNGCTLGKYVKYLKKKKNSVCFNGQNFERKMYEEYCQCTEEDWECDIGFQRDIKTNKCISIEQNQNNNLHELEQVPEKCYFTYRVSQGYRKIPGDQCVGGVDYNPILKKCPQYLVRNLTLIAMFIFIGYYIFYIKYEYALNFALQIRINLKKCFFLIFNGFNVFSSKNNDKYNLQQFLQSSQKKNQKNKNNNQNFSSQKYYYGEQDEEEQGLHDNQNNDDDNDSQQDIEDSIYQNQPVVKFDKDNFNARFNNHTDNSRYDQDDLV